MDFLKALFTSGGFQPHGFCYQWNTGLVWLNVLSDLLITLAYFAIPIILIQFIRKRKDLPFNWMFALFGVFIVACGTTHLMEVWNLWHAQYWLAGAIKATTAAASIPTAVLLARIMPQAIELPSTGQWKEANVALEKEVQERRALEVNLRISEAKYREQAELLDITHDAILVCNLRNEIVLWNKASETLYGWRKEEIEGKPLHELLQTIFPIPLTEINVVVLEKGYWEGELLHRRRDGTVLTISSRWAVRRDESGNPIAILKSNRDITRQKREQEKFRKLLEAAPDAMVIVDREGKIQLVNSQTEKVFGYLKEELLGRPVEVLVPKRFHERHGSHRTKYSGTPSRREMGAGLDLFGQRKDGTEFPVEISLSPLETEDGVLISSAIRDVTERKKAEEKFRGLLQAAPDAMVIVNQEGVIVLTNSQTEKLFGYSSEELLNKKVEMLLPERFQRKHPSYRDQFFGDAKIRPMGAGIELFARRKDGTEFPVEISLSPLETPEGTLVSSAIRDVSERRRISEALEASEERLQMALDAAQLGVWDLDLTNDSAFRSLRHDQIFGYESLQAEWGAEIAERHIVPEDRAHFRASFAEALKTSEFFMECRINRKVEPSPSWICAQGHVYRDPAGKPIRMMGVVSDTTERKQAVEELERHRQELSRTNSELAAANKELEAFSYSVSHDLRSPLRSIDGFSQALLEDYSEKLDDEGKKHLQRVRVATQRMGELIDDILNLSRVTRASMRLERVNVSDVAGEVILKLQESQPERRVEVHIEEGLEVNADSRLLKILLENLLGNAWKFTSKLPSAHIELAKTNEKGASAFFVRDDGAGFDPAYADRLFGAFQRLHAMSEFPGTGIGLATVQRIVHRHGGRVWAESSVGQGATFYFTLASTSS